jgi:hypothetical protein
MVDDPVCERCACRSVFSKADDSPNRKQVSTVIVIVLHTIFAGVIDYMRYDGDK